MFLRGIFSSAFLTRKYDIWVYHLATSYNTSLLFWQRLVTSWTFPAMGLPLTKSGFSHFLLTIWEMGGIV